MITFNQFFNEQIFLAPFDMAYYQQISNGFADTEILNRERNSMYVVMDEQQNRLGVIGLFYYERKPCADVSIDPSHRGKDLLIKFYQLLAKQHGLKRIWAYINNHNIPSIKAHEKAGFIKSTEEYGKFLYYKDF